ncbi:ABC transporter substrate-binding protein [Homoserinibacter sp. YIM 151385]|uniref:ABC transporter substrate-binding protein n=1 Tax=Homoserinibacter sp. YIM 151385 TaxID=2985506 RepID=UPI0022F02018|nr:ABC transporter substrate-binding protein [Homoserinibacter sp. YIM 151385]WBU37587.1 ABC transporter substrate-binding protein [Homoserinibacter sp. YIM 151385]
MPSAPPRRRRIALPALAALAALVLAGCAAPADAEGETAATSLLPAAEGTTSYPLEIDTWAGSTTLEERPERIAVIGFSTNLDVVEVLDVTPVYTMTEESEWAWRDPEWFASIETIDTATRRDPTNFEGIAATRPDLIIALNYVWEQADFDKLSAIAPVLEYEEQAGDQADWRAGQQLVGDVLDLGAAATTAIEEADAAIEEVAAAHPGFAGKTTTIATDYGAQYDFEYYTPTGGTAESVMLDLGFAPNPLAERFVADPVISDENLALLDGDALIVIYSDEETRQARESQPLFQAIPAVAEGRYASLAASPDNELLLDPEGQEFENATWVLRRGASAASLPWAVEVIADQWLAGVELE